MAKRGRAGNGSFRRTAKRTNPTNHYVPMRGGIRL